MILRNFMMSKAILSYIISSFTCMFPLYSFTFYLSIFLGVTGSGSHGLKLFPQFCSLIISFFHDFPTLDLGMKSKGEKQHTRGRQETQKEERQQNKVGKWQMENCCAVLIAVAKGKKKSTLCSHTLRKC